MKLSNYTFYGMLCSCVYPLAIIGLISARVAMGGAEVERLLQENTLLDLSLLALFAVGFLATPILLCIGLFKTNVDFWKAVKPFAWSLFLQALGSAILLLYVRGLARPPAISLILHLLLYSIVILVWQKNRLKICEQSEPYRLKL